MSTTYIPVELRRMVFQKAEQKCEYCLIHEDDTFFGCQVDHIIAEKHGGATTLENLALACTICNRAKGSDIATLVAGELVRLFHPRLDQWHEHFGIAVDGFTVVSNSSIGQATIQLLGFNDSERLLERKVLSEVGRYP